MRGRCSRQQGPPRWLARCQGTPPAMLHEATPDCSLSDVSGGSSPLAALPDRMRPRVDMPALSPHASRRAPEASVQSFRAVHRR